MQKHNTTSYDVIVIGGGPAGMMAAGTAAARGLRVLLLEKNAILGQKLLITGGGRCNVTNAEPDLRTLLGHYNDSSKFLFSTFTQFNNQDTLEFFNSHGMPTKVEPGWRAFPVSDTARSVRDVLEKYLRTGQVTVLCDSEVRDITHSSGAVTGVTLVDSTNLTADYYILATGGKSRPDTGSTGDGFRWLASLGHTVVEPDPSLVPIAVTEPWVKELAGLTLPDIKISVWQDGERALQKTGRVLFTHVGLSGPTILNMSKAVGELLDYGSVTIKIDLFPTLDEGSLDDKIVELFESHKNKLLRNALGELVPSSFVPVLLNLIGTAPDLACHSVTKEERKRLVTILKAFSLTVKGLLGADKAIVTSGGVSLTEVNTKTMQSRLFPNLYLVGDILNIDRPSGGYSLQLCWSTGYVAGNNIPLPDTSS